MRDEVLQMTGILIGRTEAAGYDVKPGWTWGFACRPISGTTVPSNHSWGLAVDINAPVNPMASADWHRRNANSGNSTFPFGLRIVTNIPEQVVRLWEGSGWIWGGRYSRPDPMHFEFVGTPDDARRQTARLLVLPIKPSTTTPAMPPSTPGDRAVQFMQSDRERLVRIEQHLKGQKVDDDSEPLRLFVHNQHKHTRAEIAHEGQETRNGTLKAILQQTATIGEMFEDLWVKIKKLAG
jgi:hypothetical protein